MTPTRRKTMTRVAGAAAVLIAATVLGGAVIGYMLASDPDFDSGGAVWLVGGIATVLMVGALAVSFVWMRAIDEAAREAHKAAWFWGGCSGMALGGVLVILSSLPFAERWSFSSILDGRTDPAAYAATGAFGMLLLMTIGYTIVWAWWWLARR